jgi:hypothetical protein
MPRLWIWLDKEKQSKLELIARLRGLDVKSYIEALLRKHVEDFTSQSDLHHNYGEEKPSQSELHSENFTIKSSQSERAPDPENSERILKEIRRLEDLINAYTSKADQVLQRLSQLVEAFEALSEKLDRVAEALSKQQVLGRAEEKPGVSEKSAKREKTTVCEVLGRQLVLLESEIVDKIRNRDAFFSAIESKCGDIVIEGLKERIAVEKGFWQQFLDKLSKIDTSDDDKIKKQLDPLEFKLFKALKESVHIVYSTTEKKWKPTISITAKASSTSSTEASTAVPVGSTGKSTESSTKKHYKKSYEEDESWLWQYAPEPEEA